LWTTIGGKKVLGSVEEKHHFQKTGARKGQSIFRAEKSISKQSTAKRKDIIVILTKET